MKSLKKISILFALAFISSNVANAQTTRKDKKAAHITEIKNMVEAQNYVFNANYAIPSRGASMPLTSNYDLVVSKDTIIAFLPYFGRAYAAPYNPTEGGIKFTSTNFEYKVKPKKKGGWDVSINPKDTKDVRQLYLNISSSGNTTLQITSNNRQTISYYGYLTKAN